MPDIPRVGVNGSNCRGGAVDVAAARANAGGANLVVAFVIEWSPYTVSTRQENKMRPMPRNQALARVRDEVTLLPSDLKSHVIDVRNL